MPISYFDCTDNQLSGNKDPINAQPRAKSSRSKTPEIDSPPLPQPCQSANSESLTPPHHDRSTDSTSSRFPPPPDHPAHSSSSAASVRCLPCRSPRWPSHTAPWTRCSPCLCRNTEDPDATPTEAPHRPEMSRSCHPRTPRQSASHNLPPPV